MSPKERVRTLYMVFKHILTSSSARPRRRIWYSDLVDTKTVDLQRDQYDEEEEERWKVEVQARFMRALHELDFMGFVRHTGRKPDHVIRTIYDVPD